MKIVDAIEQRLNFSQSSPMMKLPYYMIRGLNRYIMQGIPGGDFLRAVLTNDLREACLRADGINIKLLPLYAAWLYNCAPKEAYGSQEIYEAWIACGGAIGKYSDEEF